MLADNDRLKWSANHRRTDDPVQIRALVMQYRESIRLIEVALNDPGVPDAVANKLAEKKISCLARVSYLLEQQPSPDESLTQSDQSPSCWTTVPLDQQQLVAIHPPQSAAPPPPQQPSRMRTCVASLKLALRADITAEATGDPENMMESVLLFLESLQLIEVLLTDPDYADKVKVKLTQKKVAVLRRVDDLRGKLGTAEVHLNPRSMPDFRHLILSFAAAHAHCLHTWHVHDIVMYPCRSMRRGWPGKQIFYM